MGYKTIGELQAERTGLSTKGRESPVKGKRNTNAFKSKHGSRQSKLDLQKTKEIAKYVYISVRNSSNAGFYEKCGRITRFRTYCIGLLTGTNHFHYIEYKISTCHLTAKQIKTIKYLLLNKFVFNIDTEVVFDDEISKYDIFWGVFTILQTVALFPLNRISQNKMYLAVNRYFSLGVKGRMGFGVKRKSAIFSKAVNVGLLDFIPTEILDKRETRVGQNKEKMTDCIVSILYMWKKDETRKRYGSPYFRGK